MKKEMLIIGNKPCRVFPMGKVIDTFKNNIRCNFVIPGYNNDGSVMDNLAMCNHEYTNLVSHDNDLKRILSIYGSRYDNDYIEYTYPLFRENISKYNKVYYAEWNVGKCNDFLESVKCPIPVIGQPRTGFTVMMESILKGYSVFLVNFSMPHTEHKLYGFTEHRCIKSESTKQEVKIERGYAQNVTTTEESNPARHYTKNEVTIIEWLHKNEIIDASLCLVSDKSELSYNLGDLNISSYINEKLKYV
jgi:hypothetical protein